MQRKVLRKKPPKALTAVLSPSRSANRARHGSSSRHGRSRRRGDVAIAARVCSLSFSPLFFFFCEHKRSGYKTKEGISVLLNTDNEAPRRQGSGSAQASIPTWFFFFLFPPPRGRGNCKRSTRPELIGHSTIQSDMKGDTCSANNE